MNTVLLVIGMAAVTFGARYPMLVLVGRIDLPRRVFAALKFVPVAVLTAICMPIIVYGEQDSLNLALSSPHLVGGLAAIGIAAVSRRLLPTIVLGMAVFLVWRGLF